MAYFSTEKDQKWNKQCCENLISFFSIINEKNIPKQNTSESTKVGKIFYHLKQCIFTKSDSELLTKLHELHGNFEDNGQNPLGQN